MDKIIIKGARENNLKNIDIEIPKNKLVVMTGVSGSGKSSLAFDTIYAEGQRRYVDSLSAYARQFLGATEKPDVDSIEGLSPAISIEQKSVNKNPRSTVGTVTEIYDYLRLLYARIGIPHCPTHNIPIKSQSVEEMVNKILDMPVDTKIMVLAPIIHGEKGTHKDELNKIRKSGFVRVRVNGEMYDLSEDIILDKNKKSNIDVVVDRLIINADIRSRLFEALEIATKLGNGKVVINIIGDKEIVFSEKFACPYCDFSLEELEPRLFSFNAPYGACPDCKGLGFKLEIDEDLLIPNKNISINKGAILPLKNMDDKNIYNKKLEILCNYYGIDMNKKINDLKQKDLDIILYGSKDIIEFKFRSRGGHLYNNKEAYEGIIPNLERRHFETNSEFIRDWIGGYMIEKTCPTCGGAKLRASVLSVLIGNKNIYELGNMSIRDTLTFFEKLKLTKEQEEISRLIIKEIKNRITFLVNVGLNYLSLNRTATTLSGGESQRIRLATQIGSKLSGILYVLDEPSIGLHQSDNQKLINSLIEMRDLGNSLIVVEHDQDTMLQADYLIDIGPTAGKEGGYVIAVGTPKEVMDNPDSLTGRYLSGKERIDIPEIRRKGNGKYVELKGCAANNLKNINVKFPLGTMICVTGVSGSGKSSLVDEILYKAIAENLYVTKEKPGQYKSIKGLEYIDKVVNISQAPIGRTPRSNPATYVGVFDDIRKVFENTKEAKIRGYNKSRFSFNVKGGRCEACYGDGVKKIEMHFLPDVYVPCEICNGTRYNRETLEIKYKGKNIAQILNMTIEDACVFFENVPKVKNKLQVLLDVGLGYVKLGQSATTLSGGEASRVKLAKELQRKPTGKSLFILDEPTTGLHIDDIKRILVIFNRIVDNGDTVIVIEHNLDVIKFADYIIDLGPEGGDLGGEIVAVGTPEEIADTPKSYTGQYLNKILKG
ncbi:MAG: excinuclease ABC subunit UvrA [Bacilli bacterium]|nr:excinuclease ABC subunit UvrA [Bacilli bacterium]MDD3305167.1 excinuclease ABC subunit UvrA [Bacilli bacterium]MDD4053992.1 excinuclease ABC subunit UvrA [Bacilli bacterium]MDD4411727.1 excinuclease ABC subunit UvrA [Bacilli bacterium]